MSQAEDRRLLRRHEPVVRYTVGEQFFPMDVGRYVLNSSLWVQRPNEFPLRIAERGSVDLEALTQPRALPFGSVTYLKFSNPLNVTELATLRLRERLSGEAEEERFHAGLGRLARVGYASRLVDALFSLSLLARGRVPGDAAIAAQRHYQAMLAEEKAYCYYGRVVRTQGWTVLQYWFFYAYNNWRSGFYGANDHEGDWEMVSLYLYGADGEAPRPEWVAYASHDYHGDDLRRRWDDPELEKVGDHPVIYVGAGSHASYFRPGEYLAELALPFLEPVRHGVDRMQSLWERLFPYEDPGRRRRWADFSFFRVPFVDYARGDGIAIGPGQICTWGEPTLLNPPPDWVSQYRGLWGLYTRDAFSGEDAPAGPMYNRDGSIRLSWHDPLGWAGLDKVPPPDQRLLRIEDQLATVEQRQAELQAQIGGNSEELVGLQVEIEAMRGHAHMAPARAAHLQRRAEVTAVLRTLRQELAQDNSLYEVLRDYRQRIEAGERGPLRAHLERPHEPTVDVQRRGRLAEAWAAISVGVVLVGFVLIGLFAPQFLLAGFTALVATVVFIEAGVRGKLVRLIASISVALAFASMLVLLYEFFWYIVIAVVLIAGSYIIWDNLRELRH